jgi:glycosyl transferase family 87
MAVIRARSESGQDVHVEVRTGRKAPAAVRAWLAFAARPVGFYVASRFVVLLSFWMASHLVRGLGVPAPIPNDIASSVTAWDGGWYLAAAQGYPSALPVIDGRPAQSPLAFFPLYPLLLRAVHTLGPSYRMAGLLVAAAAGLATVVLLWGLLQRMWGSEAADRGVALFCFFPGALVLSMTYAEPLMLALTIGCLLALLSERWLAAGLLAALATATRPNAIALVPACAWAAAVAIRSRRNWRALVAPVIAPLGFVAFQAFLWARTGEPDAWFRTQQEGWEERLALGATVSKLREAIHHPFADVNITVAVVGTIFIAVTVVLLVQSRPPGVVLVYTLGVVLLALVSQTLGARPRFILTAFPLVAVLGHRLRGNAFALAVASSATLLGSFAILSVASLLATP